MSKRNLIQDILHKFRFSLEIIKLYKTWFLGFLDYFKILRRRKIIHKLRDKTKFLIRTRSNDFGIVNEIYIVKEYHKLLKYIKNNSVVVDIGSQVGIFSIFAAKLARNVYVYSYEPFDENFEILKKNIKLNGLNDNIKPNKLGIAGKKGKRELVISAENTGGHSFFDKVGERVEIDAITLKDIFIQNKIKEIDFLKIDCEGAEYEIIYNTPILYLKKIKSMSIEYHDNDDVSKLKEFLEKIGFEVEIGKLGEGMLYARR